MKLTFSNSSLGIDILTEGDWKFRRVLRDEMIKRLRSFSSKPFHPEWLKLVQKELKGTDPDKLIWNTAEGIAVKPLYTEEDVKIENEIPGRYPYTRGPYASMYTHRPWTIRQVFLFFKHYSMLDLVPSKRVMLSIKRIWQQDSRG